MMNFPFGLLICTDACLQVSRDFTFILYATISLSVPNWDGFFSSSDFWLKKKKKKKKQQI